MQDEQIQKYKSALEKERGMLMKEIGIDEQPSDFGSDVDHFDEATDKAEEVENHLAAANDLKQRLDEIDLALSKIREGNYGVCEKCGGIIGDDILAVAPESRFCKACKI